MQKIGLRARESYGFATFLIKQGKKYGPVTVLLDLDEWIYIMGRYDK